MIDGYVLFGLITYPIDWYEIICIDKVNWAQFFFFFFNYVNYLKYFCFISQGWISEEAHCQVLIFLFSCLTYRCYSLQSRCFFISIIFIHINKKIESIYFFDFNYNQFPIYWVRTYWNQFLFIYLNSITIDKNN